MNRFIDKIVIGVGVAIALIASYWLGQQAYGWMPPAATQEALKVDNLFSFLVSIGSFIFLGIVGTIGWALLTCRAKSGDFSEGHPARGNTALEIMWTLIPSLLVFWVAIQSQNIYQLLNLQGLHALAQPPTQNQVALAPDTVGVVAKQWSWTFHYPNQVVSNELHLPIDRPTRLVMESEDVLHGFYVPAFRVKQDIIPAQKIILSITPRRQGRYRLQDSQFSGTYFALMKADVYVESSAKFASWLAATATFAPTLAANAATIEHTSASSKLGSRWPSIAPSAPTIVNAPNSSSVLAASQPDTDRT